MKIALLFLLILPQILCAQVAELREKIEALLEGKQLIAGIALCDLKTGDTMSINGDRAFPMQSVFKLPIAITVLNRVDMGHMKLSDSIALNKEDLLPNTWSPLRERYPNGCLLPLSDLIGYTVSQSDNNGCDILLRMVGGTQAVEQHIHRAGVTAIKINEEQMQSSWEAQFLNHTTPHSMIRLLQLFARGELLSETSNSYLWDTLAATSTGSVKEKLPAAAVVAHKTGSSGRNSEGITAATNDVGIIVTPHNTRIAYAIFITNSAEDPKTNYTLIANIAQIIYHHYEQIERTIYPLPAATADGLRNTTHIRQLPGKKYTA